MKNALFLSIGISFSASAAFAVDHFANIELDPVATQEICMSRAMQALQILAASGGQTDPDISQGNWSTFGWDIPPLTADISVICPEINGQVHPFATAHTTGDGNEPGDMIEGFAEIFNKL